MSDESMKEYQILLFYKYVHISDPAAVRDWQEMLCKKYNLKGRGIVAAEGLNITLEGTVEDTEAYIADLEKDIPGTAVGQSRFLHIHMKKSVGTGEAFRKLSMKVRDEIVSAHLGVCDINPNEITGKKLSPQELHQWIADEKEFYIVDMRNMYEHKVGHFAGSILPELENFRDLPSIIKSIAHLKNKTVLTVCTGGVRCEKASGYLMSQGFADVYQLDGGIVSYMEAYPNEDFEGKLYVFDKRVMMGFYTDDTKHKIVGRCEVCDRADETFVNCEHVWCGRHFIICEECQSKQRSEIGSVMCPQGCTLRRPNKIASRRHRIWATIKLWFKNLFN